MKRIARRYECGNHGNLTVRQIARISGKSENTIYARISRGMTGAELIDAPIKHRGPGTYVDGQLVDPGCRKSIFIACRIAQVFRLQGGVPSVSGLRERFGMSRATAYRWRRAWIDAMGIDA